ncbi:50S ribosomal protein L6 [bacterium]|nr:50S ribosomal protein L6 [bacterium]
MSRVGKKPITVDKGVNVEVAGRVVKVKGPKGELTHELRDGIDARVDGGTIQVSRASDHRTHRALHGLTRALLQNMVTGVSKGFETKLEMVGVGYKAEVRKDALHLAVGFPAEKVVPIPRGVQVQVEKQNLITLTGISNEALGHFAAKVRKIRPPEPYKGKGIKFAGEQIRRKVGKTGA